MTPDERKLWDHLVSMCGGDMMITESFAEATILVADLVIMRVDDVVGLAKVLCGGKECWDEMSLHRREGFREDARAVSAWLKEG